MKEMKLILSIVLLNRYRSILVETSVLEDYMPLFTFIGIVMLSVVISITVTVLYIKLIFWLKEEYGSLSTLFNLPTCKKRGNSRENNYQDINLVGSIQNLINALTVSICGDWSYLVSNIGFASPMLLAKKSITKRSIKIPKIDTEKIKAVFTLAIYHRSQIVVSQNRTISPGVLNRLEV